VVLDIDVPGAAPGRAARPDGVTIFIVPPHVDVIRARLVARGTDTPEVIERRVRDAHSQLGRCGEYSYLVMNDDLATAHAQLQAIVVAELCRASRRRAWIEAVGGVLPAA
jgi:guanylate kinase